MPDLISASCCYCHKPWKIALEHDGTFLCPDCRSRIIREATAVPGESDTKKEVPARYSVRTDPGSDFITVIADEHPLGAYLKLTVKGAFGLARLLFEAGETIAERIDREQGEC